MVMMSLEDTEVSCVAGLSQREARDISDFSLLLHEYNGLLKVPALYVNTSSAASTVSSSGLLCLLGDPGRHMEMESSGVAAWQLPC